MREMIFNHASVGAYDSGIGEASQCLRDVVGGIGQTVKCGATSAVLWIACSYHEIRCQPGYSLHEVWLRLRVQHPDEFRFFGRLIDKHKFLEPARLTLYEERTLPAGDGLPLIFGAIADGVLIGFPSEARWDSDLIAVEFGELLSNEILDERSEEVDQLTRFSHADPICVRHRSRMAAEIGNSPSELWEKRQDVFPHLQFGADVERHLLSEANRLPEIIKKLNSLNQSGREWAESGGAVPPWKTRVTSESVGVRSDPKLLNKRYFRSRSGSQELFEWHARLSHGGRIHLRIDAGSRVIEIGYIGPHLPL